MPRPSTRKPPTRSSWSRKIISGPRLSRAWAVAVCVALIFLAWTFLRPSAELVIDVLDVGQGDAVLLRHGREEILVDGGPDASVLTGLGESLPLLDRRVETVVITHPHSDHFVGVVHVLRRYRVERIFYTVAADTAEWRLLVAAAAERGVPMEKLAAGWDATLGDNRLEALWPPPDFTSPEDDSNDFSAVLAVASVRAENSESASHGARAGAGERARALLMGDATAMVEDSLLAAGAVPRAEFLKVAHHGSRFSSSVAFLKAAAPEVAVVSVGKNSFGHPAWAALERLRRVVPVAAHVLRTDRGGHVRVTWRNSFPRVTTGPLVTLPPLK